jgi:hypothetical protein
MPVGPFRSTGISVGRRISIMSEAMKLIVEGYLSLKDRTALENIRAHRQRLRKQLEDRPKGFINVSHATELLDEELGIIEAAINRL